METVDGGGDRAVGQGSGGPRPTLSQTRESRPFRKVWSVILLICEMGNSLNGRERCCLCDGELKLNKVKDAEAPRGPHHTLLFVETSRTWGVGTWL